MKTNLLLLFILLIGCKPSALSDKSNTFEIKTYEFSSIKELLIYDLIGDPENKISPAPEINFTNIQSWDIAKFKDMNWREVKNTFLINDSIPVTNDLTIIFFTYSLKSDIIRDYKWVRKINDKYFTSFGLFSDYDLPDGYGPPKNYGNLTKTGASIVIDKMNKWKESSSVVWWKL